MAPPFRIAMLLAMALLASCGGGGGSSEPMRAPLKAGEIDRDFGRDGVASVAGSAVESQHSFGWAATQDAAGRIVATGMLAASADALATPSVTLLARFLPDGRLDASLQGSGLLAGPEVAGCTVWGVEVFAQSAGTSVVEFQRDTTGTPCAPSPRFAARRVSASGFDPAYGQAGVAPVDIVVTSTLPDADGGLLLFGRSGTSAAARRLDANGRPDPAYAANAAAALDCGPSPGRASDVKAARLPDGKVLAVHAIRVLDAPFDRDNACLVRLNADGTRDATFGNQGRLQWIGHDFAFAEPAAILAKPDGSATIVVDTVIPRPPTNAPCPPPGPPVSSLLWSTPDGRADASRPREVGALPRATAAALQRDGRIVLAGTPPSPVCGERGTPVLLRLTADGAVDASFGTGGNGIVALAASDTRLAPTHILQGSDNAIYVTGGIAGAGGSSRLAILKLGS